MEGHVCGWDAEGRHWGETWGVSGPGTPLAPPEVAVTFPIRHRNGHPHGQAGGDLRFPLRQRRGHPRQQGGGAFGRPEAAARRVRTPFRSWARRRRHGEAALWARIGLVSAPSRGDVLGAAAWQSWGALARPPAGGFPGWGGSRPEFAGREGPAVTRPRGGPVTGGPGLGLEGPGVERLPQAPPRKL